MLMTLFKCWCPSKQFYRLKTLNSNGYHARDAKTFSIKVYMKQYRIAYFYVGAIIWGSKAY